MVYEFNEVDLVEVLDEFGTPVYVGQGKVARLDDTTFFTESVYQLRVGEEETLQDQLRAVIRKQLEKNGIEGRTHISFREPQTLPAGRKKIVFLHLGFIQQQA